MKKCILLSMLTGLILIALPAAVLGKPGFTIAMVMGPEGETLYSQQAVKEWIGTHLPPGGVHAGGNFLAHGMIPSKGKKSFVWAGEPEYRTLLAEA